PTARPAYNFASPVVAYPNGFTFGSLVDIPQIWSDGVSRVLVATSSQNRVLVYNHLPVSADLGAPDLVLGQTSWTSLAPNAGTGTVGAVGFAQATGVCFDGTTLYVRDDQNNRVLGWRGWPTRTGQPADFVLGQPDFTTATPNTGGRSKATLSLGADGGTSLDCKGGRLVVSDPGNQRVLV